MSLRPFLSNILNIQAPKTEDAEYVHYSSVDEELSAMHTGLGCRDISKHFSLSLSGADTLDFLHRITTNSINDLQPGGVRSTIFTNEKGRILDSVQLFHLQNSIRVLGHNGTGKVIKFWLKKFIITDDVTVSDTSPLEGALQLFGPQTDAFLILLLGAELKEMRKGIIHSITRPEGEIHYYYGGKAAEGEGVMLFGSIPVLQSIISAAISFSGDGLIDFRMVGERAYDEYRMERGIAGHAELNDRFNPHEALLTDTVDFSKGCYIGQEVIARLETYNKVQKVLRSFILRESLPEHCLPLLYDEEENEIGIITSNIFSRRFNAEIGLGYVNRNFAMPGTRISAQFNGLSIPVTVKLPGGY